MRGSSPGGNISHFTYPKRKICPETEEVPAMPVTAQQHEEPQPQPRPQRQTSFVAAKPKRVLSNLAAEYIEVTAGHDIGTRTGTTSSPIDIIDRGEAIKNVTRVDSDRSQKSASRIPEFIPELDCFVSPDDTPIEPDYYMQSKEVMERFQETLKRFTHTLQSRDVFKKLNIEERDPAHYDLEYVQKIAASIQEYKEGEENTRVIKRFILRCSRSIHDHRTTLSCLFDMVPDDIYGSVISGSFGLIMLAVENHHEERVRIQKALASIPRKLHEIRQLTKVHRRLPRLHHCADQLFVSIFTVLETIVDRVSDTIKWRDKLRFKKGRDGDSVRDAIEVMEEKVEEFRDEVNVCLQAKIGRIGDDVVAIREGLGQVLKRFEDREKRSFLSADQVESKLQTALLNTLYTFYASNPDFNPIDGTLIRRDFDLSSPKLLAPPQPLQDNIPPVNTSQQLADTWLAKLGDFDPMSDTHISDCLLDLPMLDPQEKDKTQWIMASQPVGTWLALSGSQVLNIRAETSPSDIVNALSFSAATIALSLSKATDFAVLSFFCGFRRKNSRDNSVSGPKAVRKSLNAQLLHFILQKRPGTDISFLERRKMMEKSMRKAKHAKELFRQLLGTLPESDVVFIILDSLSRLGGTDKDKPNDFIKDICSLAKDLPQLMIKVLVTDAMPGSPIRDLAQLTLYVPDEIDGDRGDSHAISLDRQRLAVIERFTTRHRERSISPGEYSSTDSSSDDESD